MWHTLLGNADKALPPFNNYLIVEFRKRKIQEIEDYLESMFKEIPITLGTAIFQKPASPVTYIGKTVLPPEERLRYIDKNEIFKGALEIQDSSFKLLRLDFRFEDKTYSVYVYAPFLTRRHSIMYQDVEYFPLFPIVERGGVNRRDDSIIIKVMKAPLTFWRKDQIQIVTTTGQIYRECLITARIHQGPKVGKKASKTPLAIYHLVAWGWDKTRDYYGLTRDELSIVTNGSKEKGHQKIVIGDGLYLRTTDALLADRSSQGTLKRRYIASLLAIFQKRPGFTMGDVLNPQATYFQTVLGMYTGSPTIKEAMLLNNARKHLTMNRSMLDQQARFQLAQVGIVVNTLEDLMKVMYDRIDELLIGYDPTNLYDKKVGALDQIMAGFVRDVFRKLFELINADKEGLTDASFARFCKRASSNASWFKNQTTIFRTLNPSYHDNWILQIGADRKRFLDNAEASDGGGDQSKRIRPALLDSHPSQLVVESPLDIPPSYPVVTGSINTYLIIDESGNIEKPAWADDLLSGIY